MFMCKECMEQFEDADLAYTIMLEARLNHPAPDLFVMKFCSKAHVQAFLHQLSFQGQRYVLTIHGKNGDKRFEPAPPGELLLLVGSSKAS